MKLPFVLGPNLQVLAVAEPPRRAHNAIRTLHQLRRPFTLDREGVGAHRVNGDDRTRLFGVLVRFGHHVK